MSPNTITQTFLLLLLSAADILTLHVVAAAASVICCPMQCGRNEKGKIVNIGSTASIHRHAIVRRPHTTSASEC